MNYLSFLKSTLEKTSKISLSFFGKTSSSIKPEDSNQVLTEADIAIGKFIIDQIQKKFPSHNIIDEEAGVFNNNSDFTWVIDPIDGTSNFAKGNPFYANMVGLLYKNKPIAGGIALPYFKEITLAQKGLGTISNNKSIHVTKEKKLINTLIAYQIDSHIEQPEKTAQETKLLAKLILNIQNMRNSGSALDCVMTAKGIYGGYLNQTCKVWDNVAQHIVINEAEGIYTDFFGKEMDYSECLTKPNTNYTFCASSPLLHKQLQQLFHKID